jgi:hypothetical protein
MRAATVPLILGSLVVTGSLSLSLAQPAQPAPTQPVPAQTVPAQPVPWHPCAQIAAACRQAGFVPNGAKMGLGIMLDCIRPIMIGTRKFATRALPHRPAGRYGVQGAEPEFRKRPWRDVSTSRTAVAESVGHVGAQSERSGGRFGFVYRSEITPSYFWSRATPDQPLPEYPGWSP